MSTKKLDLIIDCNADFYMAMTLYDEDNNPINLGGAVIDAQLRQFPEATDSIPFTIRHNGSGGRIQMSMAHEQTSQIAYSQGVYNLRVQFSNGTTDKILEGDVFINPCISRPYAGQLINIIAITGDLPAIGHPSRLYYDFANDKIYRWDGSQYVIMMGAKGDVGISIISIEKTGTQDLIDEYTITYSDESTDTFFVTNGAKGDTGNGISTIELQSTAGKAKTYRITFTNGNYFDYIVTDGDDGSVENVQWSDIQNKPETFAPSTHNHDNRYYTVQEVDTALNGKANTDHNHDTSYAALNHSHSDASSSASGFMSSTDKTKLDGIDTNANAYVLPAASSSTLGGVKVELSTTDLEDGVSELEAGKIYLYYEV